MARAEAIFEQHNIYKDKAPNEPILPLNAKVVTKKEKQKKAQMTAGKAWGDMPKQELTEELKADLRAIQYRDKIYTKRFYKKSEYKKLPQYF